MTTRHLSRSLLLACSTLLVPLIPIGGCSDDGDPGNNDVDETGDGDGDPSGDGDGDPSGDGDGDPSGDGDGDGDPSGDGDGDPSGDGDGDPSGDGDGDLVDTTPPSVVMTTPADEAHSVLPDAVIEVTFSEPMNKASVQSAWQSPLLSADKVTFSWDEPGTVLTVTPNEPLEIIPVDGNDTPGTQYSFSISDVATDLAGNGLEPELSSEFLAARRRVQVLSVDTDLSQSIRGDGAVGGGDLIRVGDTGASNLGVRGFVSFPTTFVADNWLVLESSSFEIAGATEDGDVWSVTDEVPGVLLAQVSFTVLEAATYSTAVIEHNGIILSNANADPLVGSLDVTETVLAELEAEADFIQFRLATPIETNDNGIQDQAVIEEDDITLELTLLVP
jgi:hypothetical protein